MIDDINDLSPGLALDSKVRFVLCDFRFIFGNLLLLLCSVRIGVRWVCFGICRNGVMDSTIGKSNVLSHFDYQPDMAVAIGSTNIALENSENLCIQYLLQPPQDFSLLELL